MFVLGIAKNPTLHPQKLLLRKNQHGWDFRPSWKRCIFYEANQINSFHKQWHQGLNDDEETQRVNWRGYEKRASSSAIPLIEKLMGFIV